MNIVASMLDDAEAVALYDPVAQPFLAGLPGGGWVQFPNAVLSTPLCAPSRNTIATGQRSDHHRQTGNDKVDPLDMTANVGTWLAAANPAWATAFYGKLPNDWPWADFGLYDPGYDLLLANSAAGDGYYDWTAFDETGATVNGDPGVYFIDHIRDLAVAFIATAPEPFFLRLDPGVPHAPATPATRHAALDVGYTTSGDDPLGWDTQITDGPLHMVPPLLPVLTGQQKTDIRLARVQARRVLRAVDEMWQAIFAALEARPGGSILEDTAIFLSNDNGQPFGRHGVEEGKQRPYRWCSDAALRVRWPGQTNRVDERLVTSADLAATYAAIGGATPTVVQDGIDLRPLLDLTADASWRSSVESCFLKDPTGDTAPNWWSVLYRTVGGTQHWRYTEYETDPVETELFDQNADPAELTNVAAAPANADLVTFLSRRLAWRRTLSDGQVAA